MVKTQICDRCGQPDTTVKIRYVVEEGGLGRFFSALVCDNCWALFKATFPDPQ